ncbi:HD domain-containing protein [Erysipelotrichaceae bacterium 51-3]
MRNFERYEKIHDLVMKEFGNIYNKNLYTYAVAHTSMVDAYITLIARSRGLDVELAKVCAVLHDYFKFTRNMAYEHALRGASAAKKMLDESGLFTRTETETITHAIAEHSNKERTGEMMDEALKDADVLASWAENPAKSLSATREARLELLKEELNF